MMLAVLVFTAWFGACSLSDWGSDGWRPAG